jgi:hypothetical protein
MAVEAALAVALAAALAVEEAVVGVLAAEMGAEAALAAALAVEALAVEASAVGALVAGTAAETAAETKTGDRKSCLRRECVVQPRSRLSWREAGASQRKSHFLKPISSSVSPRSNDNQRNTRRFPGMPRSASTEKEIPSVERHQSVLQICQ